MDLNFTYNNNIVNQDGWASQSQKPAYSSVAKIIYSFNYSLEHKVVGDSLTLLDIAMKQINKTETRVHVTNVIFNKPNDLFKVCKSGRLIFQIPAWADPSVYLENMEINLQFNDSTEFMRLLIVDLNTNYNSSCSEIDDMNKFLTRNFKYFTSDNFINSKLNDSNSRMFNSTPGISLQNFNCKDDVIQTWYNSLSNEYECLIWITRTNYQGLKPLDWMPSNTDTVRCYFYSIHGYDEFFKNDSNIFSNKTLFESIINKKYVTFRLLNNGEGECETKIIKQDQAVNFINQNDNNVIYRPIIKSEIAVEEICKHFAYNIKGTNTVLIPADTVYMIDMNESDTIPLVETGNAENKTITLITLNGFPFYKFKATTEQRIGKDVDQLPPHLRGIVLNIRDCGIRRDKIVNVQKMANSNRRNILLSNNN